jgi:OmpA-OmpF porin, OOP family
MASRGFTHRLSAGLTVSFLVSLAHADGLPLALDRAAPAPAGDRFLYGESPTVRRGLALGALASYAHAPLISHFTIPGTDTETRVVRQQLMTHVQAAYGVGPLLVDAALPVVVVQGGDDAVRAGRPAVSGASGAALGDLRLGARFEVLSAKKHVVGAALGFRLFLPTGDADQYTGTGTVRAAPSVTFGGGDRWIWALSTSLQRKRAKVSPVGIAGSEAGLTLGVARRLASWQVGVEGFGATVADGQTDAFTKRTTNAEVAAVLRKEFGPLRVSAAAGPGLGIGIGTPAFRASLGLDIVFERLAPAWDPERVEVAQRDRPTDPRRPAAAAPLPASDHDQSPASPGPSPAVAAIADRDRDGIADGIDACPDVAGVASLDLARHGCPADSDHDGIIDTEDACPRQPGPKRDDPKATGCPDAVRLSATEIVILQQVQFDTGSDRIATVSFPLLTQVAEAIQQNPDIVRVSVDGHTDDVGNEKLNLTLSQRRAVAVVRWLTEHGVDARRLESRGFGPRRPIAPGKTAEARAKNRRVEFLVKRRDPAGESAWKDGPVP